MSFAERNGNEDEISEDDFTDEDEVEEEQECYENILDAVMAHKSAPPPVPRRTNTLNAHQEMDYNDVDDDDNGDYEVLPDPLDDDEPNVAPSNRPPFGSSANVASSSASASPFRRMSSSSATSGNSATSDDNDEAHPSYTRNQGRRMPNGFPVSGRGPADGGSGVRRQYSNGGEEGGRGQRGGGQRGEGQRGGGGGIGGGVVIEDGVNTAKIVNAKSNLKKVHASKIFENTTNKEGDGVGADVPRLASALRPVNGGNKGAPGGAVSPSSGDGASAWASTSEVGSGLNSVRIKGQLARLRPSGVRNDRGNSYDNNDTVNLRSENSVRDVQPTSVQKIPPATPTHKKTSQSLHKNTPPPPPPPPPPFPNPPPPPSFPNPQHSPPSSPASSLPSPTVFKQKKKTATVSAAAIKTPPSQRQQQQQPWHQATNNSPPSPPAPSPPPSSWSPIPNHATPPSGRNHKHNQVQDQPKPRTPRFDDDPSETSGKRNFGRTQSQQPWQETNHGPASANKLRAIRSGSVNPSRDHNNVHTNGIEPIQVWRDQSSSPDRQSWYFGDLDREQCEQKLRSLINRDGSYVVRNSRRGGEENPYSLSIVFNKCIYHLNIRLRRDGKFSIGKAKNDEKVFNSVAELVSFHQNNAIELIGDSQKKTVSGKVTLKRSPAKF